MKICLWLVNPILIAASFSFFASYIYVVCIIPRMLFLSAKFEFVFVFKKIYIYSNQCNTVTPLQSYITSYFS
jgi:hypothetical protein